MLQKKINPELAQAQIDSQPPSKVYQPHPKKKGFVQLFSPTFSLDPESNRMIDLGKPIATFRPCVKGEKPDAMIYCHDDLNVKGYVKC